MSRQRPKQELRIACDDKHLEMPLIVSVGFHALRGTSRMYEHAHAGFEISYLADGEVTWVVDGGERLHLAGGEMALTQPGAIHCGEWNTVRPCTVFWVLFEPERVDAPLNTPFTRGFLDDLRTRLRRAGNAVAQTGSKLPHLFEWLRAAMQAHQDDVADGFGLPRIRAILAQILVEAAAGFAGAGAARRQVPSVARAIAYLARHYSEDISMRDIARADGLSESRLYALFKAHTGQTPADYLRRTRCAHARQALLDSQASITDIAFAHGFSSSQYFACCFKKYAGMTPSAFRRQEWRRRTTQRPSCRANRAGYPPHEVAGV